MFGLRWRIESTQRTRKGQPAHSTTGLASASSSQERAAPDSAGSTCAPPMPSTSEATVSGNVQTKRRVKSRSSGLLSGASAEGSRGSSAMPQIGHAPGASRRICGCIGQVQTVPVDEVVFEESGLPAAACV